MSNDQTKSVGEIVRRQQVGATLQQLSAEPSIVKVEPDGTCSLSIYKGELTQDVAAKGVAKIKAAFPSLPREFFAILLDRVKAKKFTNEQLMDSINHVIDTCQYPSPTLANFLTFDRRVKLITYSDLCNLTYERKDTFDNYARISIKGKAYYVRKCDKVLYNVPDEI